MIPSKKPLQKFLYEINLSQKRREERCVMVRIFCIHFFPALFFFLTPSLVFGAETFSSFLGRITGIINLLIPLVFVFMFLGFTWTAIQVILSADPSAKGKGDAKVKLFWGVIVLFVSLSIWSIVRFLFSSLLQ